MVACRAGGRSAAAAGARAATLALVVGTMSGCRTAQTWVKPDPHLNRMLVQPKRLAYGSDPQMPGGMVMQTPPGGTIPIDAIVGDPLLALGYAGGRWADRIPVAVDRPFVEMGRRRFEIFCAACHGVLGDGDSMVARKMSLRKPPSLLSSSIAAYPPGRVFATIREGYGLMPSYAVQLTERESWAVVAYVQALQLARAARVAELPALMQALLAKEAP